MPEPMPRPIRIRALRDPGLSLSSLRRIAVPPSTRAAFSGLVDDPHEMADLFDHAAHRGRILERAPPAQLVETKADQCLLLVLGPTVRALDLLDRYRLARLGLRCHRTLPRNSPAHAAASPADSASAPEPSRRRATISLTFL